MRKVAFFAALTVFGTVPAFAQEEPVQPLANRDVTAMDVAATPITDLNIRKDRVPAQLIAAQEKPYDLTNLGSCSRIASAVGELDAILGDDLDMPQTPRSGRPSAGRLAQWAVGSFIPFRGAIREISGANAQQRRMVAAIQAGQARRGFLKGVGEARGCRYPARSATAEVIAQRAAENAALAKGKDDKAPAAVASAADARAAATGPARVASTKVP